MSACNAIHATCFAQQPVPLTLQLRTSWFRVLPRVLLGVAAKTWNRGFPSSTTALHTLARRFLRSAFAFAGCDAELAASGAGGVLTGGSLCTPTVRVSTAFFRLVVVPSPAAPSPAGRGPGAVALPARKSDPGAASVSESAAAAAAAAVTPVSTAAAAAESAHVGRATAQDVVTHRLSAASPGAPAALTSASSPSQDTVQLLNDNVPKPLATVTAFMESSAVRS
mmetsp:Transcript_30254/g.70594  ORF Transcript_30254/g.70594 Transcript_30254/m.70594 type:complete len:224 (-) Transcript_30254:557-1228(-)